MSLKVCNDCGTEISKDAKNCPKCGKDQRNFFVKHKIIIIVSVFILFCIASSSNNTTKTSISANNSSENISESSKDENLIARNANQNEKDKTKVIYEDENILVKIIDYKCSYSVNTIEFQVYIENNSEKELNFSIDGDIAINGYMVDGGYFYEKVNAKTKANKSFKVRNLNSNGINKDNLSSMSFKFDIYESKNYIINNRILDDYIFTYEF